MSNRWTRRQFLERMTHMAGAITVGAAAGRGPAPGASALPRRTLGRTGAKVSIVGLGLGPLGIANYPPEEVEQVVTAALDLWGGVVCLDVQPDYGDAESSLAPLLARRRRDIFIVTKTWEQAESAVLASIQESLRRLKVSVLDAVLLNNIGMFDGERLFRPGGALAGLKKAQKQGLVRFIGISGHMGTGAFVKALESGEFDIVMPVVNFVDRHTYNFEEKVLPVAAKHDVGIAAMKVLGGAVSLDYSKRSQRALLIGHDYRPAVHYALGIAGVATAIIGCKTVKEVQSAAEAARSYRPLDGERYAALMERGRQLAAQWGEHFGPR